MDRIHFQGRQLFRGKDELIRNLDDPKPAHDSMIRCIGHMPPDQYMVSADECTVRLWHLPSGFSGEFAVEHPPTAIGVFGNGIIMTADEGFIGVWERGAAGRGFVRMENFALPSAPWLRGPVVGIHYVSSRNIMFQCKDARGSYVFVMQKGPKWVLAM